MDVVCVFCFCLISQSPSIASHRTQKEASISAIRSHYPHLSHLSRTHIYVLRHHQRRMLRPSVCAMMRMTLNVVTYIDLMISKQIRVCPFVPRPFPSFAVYCVYFIKFIPSITWRGRKMRSLPKANNSSISRAHRQYRSRGCRRAEHCVLCERVTIS